MRHCILASASPRRKEILQQLGVPFEVFVTDVDESTDETSPTLLAEELSARKGRAARDMLLASGRELSGRLIIASDTTVSIDREILGKPKDDADAYRMLRLLSGRTHRVVSGIYLWMDGKEAVSHAVTEVDFAPLSEQEINDYIRMGEPYGKAGSYAIQGIGAALVEKYEGSYSNIVGLPTELLAEMLKRAGWTK